MILYQVKDWDANFENSKSRERIQCSFVCVPNKQHGMSFSKIMAEKDGAMIYGIWQLILGACSQQKKPRNGWMTQDGYQTGTPWVPEDLALKFRRPVSEITRSLEVLCSESVGWIIDHEKEVSTRSVPAEYPIGIVKEGKKEGSEMGNHLLNSKTKHSKSSYAETPFGHKWCSAFKNRFGHKYEWQLKDNLAAQKIMDREEGWEVVLGWAISAWDSDSKFLRELSISISSFQNNLVRFIPQVSDSNKIKPMTSASEALRSAK